MLPPQNKMCENVTADKNCGDKNLQLEHQTMRFLGVGVLIADLIKAPVHPTIP
jgi:hypothetical protein